MRLRYVWVLYRKRFGSKNSLSPSTAVTLHTYSPMNVSEHSVWKRQSVQKLQNPGNHPEETIRKSGTVCLVGAVPLLGAIFK
jgi:hypothetical protein